MDFKSAKRSTNRVIPVIEVRCQLTSDERKDLAWRLGSKIAKAARKDIDDCLAAEYDSDEVLLQLNPSGLDKLTDTAITNLGKAAARKANENIRSFAKASKAERGR